MRVGFEVFEKGLVYTRELGRQVTNALFFNNPKSDIQAALRRYHHVVSDITFADDPNLNITVPTWYFSADDAGYVIPKSDAMLAMLQQVARQTDDLPATEFFLSQQTIWPLDPYYSTTRKDPRYWENVGGFALDGTDGSRDLAQGATRAVTGNTITFDLPVAAIVRGYDLIGSPKGEFPSAWTVEGSNDGTAWEEINRVANFANWEGVSGGRMYPKYGRVFWFKNAEAFDRYRLKFDRPANLIRIRLFENSVFDHGGMQSKDAAAVSTGRTEPPM